MTLESILSVLRHVLQVGAGALMAKGVIDEATAEAAVGAVVSIVTVAWFFYTKKQAGDPK